jgi:hypothetical protein
MTIDERLDKLTERHEALAQSLELNASLQRDHDQRVGQAIEALNHAIETLASLHAAQQHCGGPRYPPRQPRRPPVAAALKETGAAVPRRHPRFPGRLSPT